MSQSHVARFRNPLSPPWVWTRPQKAVWNRLDQCIRGDEGSLHITTRTGVGLRTLLARLRSVSGFNEFAIDVATVRLTSDDGRLQIRRCDGSRRELRWTRQAMLEQGGGGTNFEWPHLSPDDLIAFLDRCGWIARSQISADAAHFWIEKLGGDLNRVQKDIDRWYQDSKSFERLTSSWLGSIHRFKADRQAA
ncbi:MAG: hypothetical protein AAF664_04440 [Planctomycetota bacterium]